MATLLISIGTFIVYSICVIVLAIGGLSMTSAGQTFETMFNNFFGTVIPSNRRRSIRTLHVPHLRCHPPNHHLVLPNRIP